MPDLTIDLPDFIPCERCEGEFDCFLTWFLHIITAHLAMEMNIPEGIGCERGYCLECLWKWKPDIRTG